MCRQVVPLGFQQHQHEYSAAAVGSEDAAVSGVVAEVADDSAAVG